MELAEWLKGQDFQAVVLDIMKRGGGWDVGSTNWTPISNWDGSRCLFLRGEDRVEVWVRTDAPLCGDLSSVVNNLCRKADLVKTTKGSQVRTIQITIDGIETFGAENKEEFKINRGFREALFGSGSVDESTEPNSRANRLTYNLGGLYHTKSWNAANMNWNPDKYLGFFRSEANRVGMLDIPMPGSYGLPVIGWLRAARDEAVVLAVECAVKHAVPVEGHPDVRDKLKDYLQTLLQEHDVPYEFVGWSLRPRKSTSASIDQVAEATRLVAKSTLAVAQSTLAVASATHLYAVATLLVGFGSILTAAATIYAATHPPTSAPIDKVSQTGCVSVPLKETHND